MAKVREFIVLLGEIEEGTADLETVCNLQDFVSFNVSDVISNTFMIQFGYSRYSAKRLAEDFVSKVMSKEDLHTFLKSMQSRVPIKGVTKTNSLEVAETFKDSLGAKVYRCHIEDINSESTLPLNLDWYDKTVVDYRY